MTIIQKAYYVPYIQIMGKANPPRLGTSFSPLCIFLRLWSKPYHSTLGTLTRYVGTRVSRDDLDPTAMISYLDGQLT